MSHYIAITGQASTCEEAIRLAGQALQEAGYVGNGFIKGCTDREKEYPTGLCTDIPVAIPHCQSDEILKTGVCYLRLQEPVVFRRMDDDEETVATRHIFNLAIKGADNHMGFLQKMMGMVTDLEVLKLLESAPIEEIPALLERSLDTEEGVAV